MAACRSVIPVAEKSLLVAKSWKLRWRSAASGSWRLTCSRGCTPRKATAFPGYRFSRPSSFPVRTLRPRPLARFALTVLRQGRIFKDEFDVPVEWVEDLSDKGVVLNVERGRVESLSDRS
jgi:hypothetical protein